MVVRLLTNACDLGFVGVSQQSSLTTYSRLPGTHFYAVELSESHITVRTARALDSSGIS